MKIITDYEVEGAWSGTGKSKCRLCGTVLEKVPRKGHYNSQYWYLERDDGTVLVCCPEGCNVKIAAEKIKEYLKIRNYCKDNSQSWNYELDYNKIPHAWINRQGKVYPVGLREHVTFAFERNTEEKYLEKQGWVKLSSREFYWEKKLSKRQIDIVFDYIKETGTKVDMQRFRECIDSEIDFIKIGK